MDRRNCEGFLQVCMEVDFNSQYPWCWFDKREVDELKALQFEFMQMVDQADDETWQSVCQQWGRPFMEVLEEGAPIQPSAHMFPMGPPPPYHEVLGLLNERMNFRPNLQSQNEGVVAQNQLAFVGIPSDGVQHPNVDIHHPNVDYQHPFLNNQNPNLSVQQPGVAFQQPNIAIQQPHIAFQQPNFDMLHPAWNERGSKLA